MTVLTPTEEGVKVFTLPEKPEDWVDDEGYLASLTSPLYARKMKEYKEAIAQAKSSAILVKDQDEAKKMIYKLYVFISSAPEIGKNYPIPGLKYRVEKVAVLHLDNESGCLTPHFKEAAILSLEEEKKEPKLGDKIAEVFKDIPKGVFDKHYKASPVSDGETQEELIDAYKEYVALLNDEINSLLGVAHVHGWRSQNVEKGKACREKIDRLSKGK